MLDFGMQSTMLRGFFQDIIRVKNEIWDTEENIIIFYIVDFKRPHVKKRSG